MSDDALRELARAAGVQPRWRDYRGADQEASGETLRGLLAALELPTHSPAAIGESLARLRRDASIALPKMLVARVGTVYDLGVSGRAQLELEGGGTRDLLIENGRLPPIDAPGYHHLLIGDRRIALAVTPPRCFTTADLGLRRIWGPAAQLYALRRHGDGGAGDFGALAELARAAAGRGADALGISPIHALFAADHQRWSPYSPSSRLFRNGVYATPALTFGSSEVEALIDELQLRATLRLCETQELIDWPTVMRSRYALLHALYERHEEEFANGISARATSYRAYIAAAGERLEEHARFEALHTWQLARGGAWHWREWPQPLRDPASVAVSAFAREHAREIAFHKFVQWLTDQGLEQAQRTAREAGMRVGLIADLAIGTDTGGSYAWSRQHELLAGVTVGAPPDLLNLDGQNWGLTAVSPRALTAAGYAPFIEMLQASLRHAGGLRIDHVLGMNRLWLVPQGASPREGAYLNFPLADLLALTALESWRARALIIGEDLGTVPEGFRTELDRHGVLGMQVLWFEREHGYFIAPPRWSDRTAAVSSTHDLPTVAGWWRGRDLQWNEQLDRYPGQRAAQTQERAADRRKLWDAFVHGGVAQGNPPPAADAQPVVDAALTFVVRTPAPLALFPMEDLLGQEEQANLPGTIDEHPNWRRRLTLEESRLDTPDAQRRTEMLQRGRNRE